MGGPTTWLSREQRIVFATQTDRHADGARPAAPRGASFSAALGSRVGLDAAQWARIRARLPGNEKAGALRLELERRIAVGTIAFASPSFDAAAADSGFGTATIAGARARRNAAFVRAALPELDASQRLRLVAELRARAARTPPRQSCIAHLETG